MHIHLTLLYTMTYAQKRLFHKQANIRKKSKPHTISALKNQKNFFEQKKQGFFRTQKLTIFLIKDCRTLPQGAFVVNFL